MPVPVLAINFAGLTWKLDGNALPTGDVLFSNVTQSAQPPLSTSTTLTFTTNTGFGFTGTSTLTSSTFTLPAGQTLHGAWVGGLNSLEIAGGTVSITISPNNMFGPGISGQPSPNGYASTPPPTPAIVPFMNTGSDITNYSISVTFAYSGLAITSSSTWQLTFN